MLQTDCEVKEHKIEDTTEIKYDLQIHCYELIFIYEFNCKSVQRLK